MEQKFDVIYKDGVFVPLIPIRSMTGGEKATVIIFSPVPLQLADIVPEEQKTNDLQELYQPNGQPQAKSAQEMWDELKNSGDDEDDPEAMNRAISALVNRTPEEIEASRLEVMKDVPEPLPLPPGKTVFDMLFRIRGDETEEQVRDSIERMS